MAIADWYTGVAQEYLKEVGTREELTNGYGVSARQLRRWINAFNEGGIPGLLERRFGRGGRRRKIKAVEFTENFLAVAEQSVSKRNGWVSGKALFNWCRTNLGLGVSYSTFLRYLGGRLRSFRKPVVTPMMDEYLAGIRSGQWPEHLKEFGIKYRKKERQAQKKRPIEHRPWQ
jgi:transposase